jgi:hypothetical protein
VKGPGSSVETLSVCEYVAPTDPSGRDCGVIVRPPVAVLVVFVAVEEATETDPLAFCAYAIGPKSATETDKAATARPLRFIFLNILIYYFY